MDFDSPNFFHSGNVCLDFCNTFDHRHTPPEYDFLPDRDSLIRWGRKAGILAAVNAAKKPSAASFLRLMKTRRMLFELLGPFSQSVAPEKSVLESFSMRLRAIALHMAVKASPEGYLQECRAEDPFDRIECAVLRSASDLLLSHRTDRIRVCQGCGWLFYDSTRNRSRRWCTMDICGNRAKAHRHYQRIRRSKQNASGARRSSRR